MGENEVAFLESASQNEEGPELELPPVTVRAANALKFHPRPGPLGCPGGVPPFLTPGWEIDGKLSHPPHPPNP